MSSQSDCQGVVQRSQLFVVWIACLIASFFYHLYLNYGVYFASRDDFYSWMTAESYSLGSKSLYLAHSSLAQHNGRFYYHITAYLNVLDKMIDSVFLRAGLLSFIHILVPLVFGLLLYKYQRKLAYLFLFVPAVLFMSPIYNGWHIYYHWAVYYKSSFILFACGELAYFKFYKGMLGVEKLSRVQLLAYWGIGAICLFLASLCYEVFLIGYAALSLCLALLLFKSLGLPFSFRSLLKVLAFKLPPLVIYMAMYIAYGISVNWGRMASVSKLSLAPEAIIHAGYKFFLGAMPINPTIYKGIDYIFPYAFSGVEAVIALIVLIFFVIFVASAIRISRARSHGAEAFEGESSLSSGLKGLFVAFGMYAIVSVAFIAPLIVTERYQSWMNLSCYYVPTFYLTFFFLLLVVHVATIFIFSSSSEKKSKWGAKFSVFLVAPIIFLSVYSVNLLALGVHKMNALSNAPWILLDKAFDETPSDLCGGVAAIVQDGFMYKSINEDQRNRKGVLFKAMVGCSLPFYYGVDDLVKNIEGNLNGDCFETVKPVLLIQYFASGAVDGGVLMASRVSRFKRLGENWVPVGRKGMFYGDSPWGAVRHVEMRLDNVSNVENPFVRLRPSHVDRWFYFDAATEMELDYVKWYIGLKNDRF